MVAGTRKAAQSSPSARRRPNSALSSVRSGGGNVNKHGCLDRGPRTVKPTGNMALQFWHISGFFVLKTPWIHGALAPNWGPPRAIPGHERDTIGTLWDTLGHFGTLERGPGTFLWLNGPGLNGPGLFVVNRNVQRDSKRNPGKEMKEWPALPTLVSRHRGCQSATVREMAVEGQAGHRCRETAYRQGIREREVGRRGSRR